jgi:hypothetical protein
MVGVFKIEKYVVRRELCCILDHGEKCAVNGPELSRLANESKYVYGTSSQDPDAIAFQTSALRSGKGSSYLARLSRPTCNSPGNAKGVFVRKS